MPKSIICSIAILVILISWLSRSYAQTKDFHVSVTVPAIPGFNVPEIPTDIKELEEAQIHEARLRDWQIIEEHIWRDNQEILLKTITVK